MMMRIEPISARIWVAKGDSPSSMPATKAPSAGEMCNLWAAQAAPKPTAMLSRTVNSRLAKSFASLNIKGAR